MLPWATSATMFPCNPRLTHFAINTDDVDATQTFYASVFGWQFQDHGPPGFVQILDESGNAPKGAILQRRQILDNDPTRGFECTFGVDDVDIKPAEVMPSAWHPPVSTGLPWLAARSRSAPTSGGHRSSLSQSEPLGNTVRKRSSAVRGSRRYRPGRVLGNEPTQAGVPQLG